MENGERMFGFALDSGHFWTHEKLLMKNISARKVLRPQDFFQPLFDVKEINIESKTLITGDIDVLMCFITNHN